MRLAKKEKKKKILILNSVHTRSGQENSEKNFKKIRKIIKPLPGIFFFPKLVEMGQKRGKKSLVSNSVHTRPGQENSKKK